MKFNPAQVDLPVTDIIDKVRACLQKSNRLIVSAPPGAGKSTILPLALLEQPWLADKKIYMLEPRRLAARTIAERMASLLGEKVGETIGYRIRFESKISERTRLEVLTEGILTRMLLSDNALEDGAIVIFDEFHERSIHADTALALCREAQEILRPDLRILLMSATLDSDVLAKNLECEAVKSEGKMYPVDVRYVGENDLFMIPEIMARTILLAANEEQGDVLAFLPGQGEIRKTEELLKKQMPGTSIRPLYGMLPQNKQIAAILPHPEGKRKVVLATSIAETSLTIEGIRIVVDSGFSRNSVFDANTGLSRLETLQVSKDTADQRTGRAGRLTAGVCYRIWTRATQERLEEQRVPEIAEADLAPLVLFLAKWGKASAQELTWVTSPPPGTWAQAQTLLHDLGALEHNRITAHGDKMVALPCHPRIAHLLLSAIDHDLVSLACDLAAMIEERDPLPEVGTDINIRIEALRRHRRENRQSRKFSRIEKVSASYRQMMKAEVENDPFDPFETGILLTYAYPERIAHARPGNNAQFKLANGSIAQIGHKDDLAHESWLAVASINARSNMGKIFLASPLNPRDLAPMVKSRDKIYWDIEADAVAAEKQLYIGNIILQSKPLVEPGSDDIKAAVINYVKSKGSTALDFNTEVVQWQNRVSSLRQWNIEEHWPDASTPALISNADLWLLPYLDDVRNGAKLKKLNLMEILQYGLLDQTQQNALRSKAPVSITVPSGSNIKLKYKDDGNPPILAVRIQEIFGLKNTPTVNNGKTPVLLHLLSPGYKPVQVTNDLNSFWSDTYHEIKKELKGRYPKHAWPEDPKMAEPLRGVKKKK